MTAADNGPRNGVLPTDPFLVNGPVINTALLQQMFPGGQLLRNTGASWDSPDRRTPYTDEVTAGFERQIKADLAVSADYVHSQGRDMLMTLNLNPLFRSSTVVAAATPIRIGSSTLTAATAALQAKYPGFVPVTAAVSQVINAGQIDYDAVMLQMKKRFSHNYSAQVSYTYGKSRGNTSGLTNAPVSNFQVGDDLHLERNEGPTNFDVPHNFTVSGTALIPRTHGLNVSWVARALSGSPFTVINSNFDPDQNGVQAEPLPDGSYSGTGNDPYTLEGYRSERNGARGPGFFEFDTRIGYGVNLHGRRLEISADIFNLTNHTNFGNPGNDQASASSFLVLTGYSTSYTPRKVQVGARFEF